jgi:hypothetical protein
MRLLRGVNSNLGFLAALTQTLAVQGHDVLLQARETHLGCALASAVTLVLPLVPCC